METNESLAENTSPGLFLKAAHDSRSLEEFIESWFSECGNGICITPPSILAFVPDLCRLVQEKEITDHSHYDGYVYDPGKPSAKNASLILNGNRLFLNDHDLRCRIDDPSLESLRIQLHSSQYGSGDKIRAAVPEATLYFDFWDEEKGFSKKCVILYIRLARVKLSRVESELANQKNREAKKRIQELEAKRISPTTTTPSDRGQLGLF